MNEVYILTYVLETAEDYADIRTLVYRDFGRAIKAYNVLVDEVRDWAEEHYCGCTEDKEIATDSFRFFRVFDNADYGSVTITVETKEIIETEDEAI